MKRKLSILLAMVLITVSIIPAQVFAQEDKALEKAISTAKSLLNITDTYDSFSYSIRKQDEKNVYDLSWNDSKNKLGSVSVSIDSDGKVLGYYTYRPYDDRTRSKVPSVSKTDAQKTAEEFIKKVNPSVWEKLEIRDDNSPLNINDDRYHFNYIRVENKIPYYQNSVRISVNNRTGKVEDYSCNFSNNLVFPTANDILTLDKAQQMYTEKLGLKLTYKLKYKDNDQSPYLVYTNVYSSKAIDAKTGEVFNKSSIYYGGDYEKAAGAAQSTAMDNKAKTEQVNLTPEEKGAIENAANLMSQEKAESSARSILGIDNSYKMSYINLYSNGLKKKDYTWNIGFSKEEKKDSRTIYYSTSISLDAVTGDVLSFYKSGDNDNNKAAKYTKEQSLDIAKAFIKSMQPQKSSETEYTTWNEPEYRVLEGEDLPRTFYFTFTRKHSNIYFPENGFNVTVDTATGSVTNYNFTWYKEALPTAGNVISPSQAHKALYENVGLELQYIGDYSKLMDRRKIMPPPEREMNPELRLIYSLKPQKPANIDALTGKILDYSGDVYEERAVAEYSDTKGNQAENSIKMLAQFGISLPGSEFKPDQNIAQRDFLYLLIKCTDPYVEFKYWEDSKAEESFYNHLINTGIIVESEKSPWSAITKEDAVKFIIRAMRYEKVASIKGIYTVPFKDASSIKPELYGYVALAYGLKIVDDEGNGNFRPMEVLSRGKAAMILYNFISKS